MVCGPKFYIHDGDKWLELYDDGRFENWGRAKFAFINKGKVRIAKTKAVLTSLKDFRAGLKTAIRDGARIPHKKIISSEAIQHTELKITKMIINQTRRSDIAIQTTPLPLRSNQWPRRDSMSSIEIKPRQITTTAMINTTPNKLTLKKNWTVKTVTAPVAAVTPKNIQSIKLHKQDSSNYDLYKRKRTDSSDSIVWVVLPKNVENPIDKRNNEENQKASKLEQQKRRRCSSSSGSESPPRKIVKRTKSVSDLPSIKQKINSIESAKGFVDKNLKKLVQHDNNSDENTLRRNTERGTFHKELLITEEDIEVLRHYLIRNGSDFDLLRFDEDDRYKQELFSKINPLVSLVRCSNIAQMLKSNCQKLRLKDLTSNQGLNLISDRLMSKRYKMKNQNFYTDESDNETDKPNSKDTKSNIHVRHTNKITSHTHNIFSTGTESDSDVKMKIPSTTIHRYQENKSQTSSRNLTRQVDKKKNINHKNDEKPISLPDTTDSESATAESSVEKTKGRVMRKKMTRNSNNITRNSIRQSKTDNENTNIKTNEDKTKLNDDSDSDFEIKRIMRTTTSSGKISKDMESNKESSKQKSREKDLSIKEINKTIRTLNKATQTDSDSDDEVKTKKTRLSLNKTNTPLKNNQQHKKDNEQNKKENEQNKKGNEQNKKDNEKPRRKSSVKTTKSGNKKTTGNQRNLIRNEKENSTDEDEPNKTISEDEIKTAKERNYKRLTKEKQMSQLNDENSDNNKQTSIKSTPKPNKIKNIADNAKKDDLIDTLPEKHLNSSLRLRTPLKIKLNSKATSEDLNKNNDSVKTVSNNLTTKDTTPVLFEPRQSFERSASSASMARQPYSSLEDQAIVSWVSNGPRAHRVNGNAMWKELEESYYNITAQNRSWHSLRNRYLRSILPRLPRLGLDPATVKKLRAAAATGEMKARPRAEPDAAYNAKLARLRRASSSDPEPPRKKQRLSLAIASLPPRVTRSSIGTRVTRVN